MMKLGFPSIWRAGYRMNSSSGFDDPWTMLATYELATLSTFCPIDRVPVMEILVRICFCRFPRAESSDELRYPLR
jgi:hypothetical protein